MSSLNPIHATTPIHGLTGMQTNKSGEINEYCWLVKQQLSGLNPHACLDGMEDIEAAISCLSDTLIDATATWKVLQETWKMQLFEHSAPKAELPCKPGRRTDVWKKDRFVIIKGRLRWEA